MWLRRLMLCACLTGTAWAFVSARAVTIEIGIENVAFQRAEVKAKVGDTIEWINRDIFDHTATAKNGDWTVTIAAGKKGRIVLKKAGTVDYYCRLHPNMTARLIVAK